MKKISVIVPNYNNEKYLEKCINSIVNQKYDNLEVIVIDDGSTDNSVSIIEKIINKYCSCDIKFIKQKNLNASIARNKGMDIATGDYLLFLDSDDELEDDILNKLNEIIERENSDLLIGNYIVVNENDELQKNNNFFDSEETNEKDVLFDKLIRLSPVPSNKLYSKRIIDKFGLYWGNVRIGQDLNFYLKYLLCCEKITMTDLSFYRYRIVESSMSRIYNYKIFDIVESFNDVKKFYKNNNGMDLYEKYIQIIELNHYSMQLKKCKYFTTMGSKKLVVDYFKQAEKNINYRKCVNLHKRDKQNIFKFKIKVYMKYLYLMILKVKK